MADKTTEILLRKPDDAFRKFITLLNETGQSHVAFILTGEGSSRPLKEEYRRRLLSSSRVDLVKKIDSKHNGLITNLISKGVFSSYDEQRVTSVQPNMQEDRNETIINLITRKSQTDFFNFILALNDTGQTHVVVELIGANIVANIKTVYESDTQGGHVCDVDTELAEYVRGMFESNGDAVRRLNGILANNGVTVLDVSEESMDITFTCINVQSMRNFQSLNNSVKIEKMLNEAFLSQFAKKGLKSLKLAISKDQFNECSRTFNGWIPMTSKHCETLLLSQRWLVDKMTVSDSLLDKLPLCKRRREAIENASTREEQVKTLIDIVSR